MLTKPVREMSLIPKRTAGWLSMAKKEREAGDINHWSTLLRRLLAYAGNGPDPQKSFKRVLDEKSNEKIGIVQS
nr:hypothetical protein [uncultured Desulfobulbus sp.]